jgi:SulP family sulfate permease
MQRLVPFLAWFPLSREKLRSDLIAGTTVTLVLIPQSMAYAQLAGMPAYYGLYAAFLPVAVGAAWGSSRQLATGPVAMVSLLTGATLAQFAAPNSDQFVMLAITLTLMVGVMELVMGVFKLGAIVSFLSHPVIAGFTSAAAIIIALSQLNRFLGVAVGRSEYFMADIWSVLQQTGETHVPTLVMGLAALALMWLLRKYLPRVPGVLIVVALSTLVSWQIGYGRYTTAHVDDIVDNEVRTLGKEFAATVAHTAQLTQRIAEKNAEIKAGEKTGRGESQRALALRYETEVLRVEIKDAERENRLRQRALRKFLFERTAPAASESGSLYLAGRLPAGLPTDGQRWRITRASGSTLELAGGGEVVGAIPLGLPPLALPRLSWDVFMTLLSTAFVITLVGFMEAVSIAKAIATKTRQRIDPNQELIGQGLANIVGSFTQSFPVSGSFSRSAVNLSAGAATGMSSVFTAALVLVTLLFLTPLLYHLPQSVLAAVIMLSVLNLISFEAIRHAWKAHRHDGYAAIATFIATLGFAPHLDSGILAGGGLAIVLYLFRTMTPRVALLGRHPDGTLRDARLYGLPTRRDVVVIRYDGSLYFANVPYFEDSILEEVANHPHAKFILVVGDGINQLDASGEEVIRHLVEQLRENNVTMAFSGLKKQVLDVMRATGLDREIGEHNLFRTEDVALAALEQRDAEQLHA